MTGKIAKIFNRIDRETGKITAEDNHANVNNFRDNQCKKSGIYCGWLIERNGWKVPNDYPIKIQKLP